MGEMRDVYRILVGKLEWKRLFERPRHRGSLEDVDWIHVTQGRDQWQALLNTVMRIRIT
jgi:hypothetical protein